jgi:hypothetical protein
MKTTLTLPDSLLKAAKKLAAQERTTVSALIEQGLRQILLARKRPNEFRLRKATFKGLGLQPGVSTVTSDQIRDMTYEDQGG